MFTRRPSGMTLIELMVAITIIGLLIVLGAPGYSTWITNTRIRNAAESIQNALRLARDQAVQRGTSARFELTSASGGADWTVCIPAVATPTTCASPLETVQQFNSAGGANLVKVGSSTNLTYATDVSGTVSAGTGITFNALGRPTGTTPVVRIDASTSQSGSRRLITVISPGGSVRMCDPALSQSTSPQGCS
ncbi:GspH/FimT family pseudopilin [Dokdonella soli]|uniref:Type II secretion system protein H n=1 Tax=Dokdonella soli TaxID=529810 RepID=A0ABN1IBU5_9GAMM